MFNNQWTASAIIGISLLFVILIIFIFMKIRKRNQGHSFAKRRALKLNRPASASSGKLPPSKQQQSCSYCKRKVNPKELTFYSGVEKVVGVCRSCRPQAERQSLHRL
ncbi:hypothetical protein GC093_07530 [Paenibacillus sp. LMG 31456]|uniref:Uncharacterized protein n=1 Tax=Paenibacillus foliorum TaxID=2654974 RepID=A0A972JY24_9BACL|nr:hypothetical protein [Paenibacillus foliorum]NOU93084.1 hypothetical protein [Paenibacillus foliorum]